MMLDFLTAPYLHISVLTKSIHNMFVYIEM